MSPAPMSTVHSPLLVGNWKMNLLRKDARDLAQAVAETARAAKKTEIWIAPPLTAMETVLQAVQGSPVKVGAQNVHWEKRGAFTGEVSLPMLKDLGTWFAIVGHSERRHIFGEPNDLVARRALAALQESFPTILCIGETQKEREEKRTFAVIKESLAPVLDQMKAGEMENLVIAYEPVWAIGTGNVATIAQIEEVHRFITEECHKRAQHTAPLILYGGSVTPDNFTEIINSPWVSGALVGGASLKPESFQSLIQIAEKS